MKLSISEARKKLPQLVRQVRKDPGAPVQITVRDEIVVELRAIQPGHCGLAQTGRYIYQLWNLAFFREPPLRGERIVARGALEPFVKARHRTFVSSFRSPP